MIRLADWFGYQVLDKLTDEQIQQDLDRKEEKGGDSE
jgi:hypothetical protein